MKILKHLICTFVVYSMAFATPVAGFSSNASSDFERAKSYLNSKGKKNYRSFLMKMEKSLPSNFYEESMKSMKGKLGKGFFDSAKVTNRYAYFRFDGSKILIRFKTKKGKIVFLANGIEINEGDFKNMEVVYGKLLRAHIKGRLNKSKKTRTSFLNLMSWNQAVAIHTIVKFDDDGELADSEGEDTADTRKEADKDCAFGTSCYCDRSFGKILKADNCDFFKSQEKESYKESCYKFWTKDMEADSEGFIIEMKKLIEDKDKFCNALGISDEKKSSFFGSFKKYIPYLAIGAGLLLVLLLMKKKESKKEKDPPVSKKPDPPRIIKDPPAKQPEDPPRIIEGPPEKRFPEDPKPPRIIEGPPEKRFPEDPQPPRIIKGPPEKRFPEDPNPPRIIEGPPRTAPPEGL